jgi:long-subunit acyl-CoA synthetase (AMP-forming)
VTDRHSIEPGTVGRLAPGTQVRFNASGEILIKSRAMFSGYWRDDKVYAESFEDGWFRSGDKGRVDKLGNLIVTGRAYDVLEYEPGVELAIPFLAMAYAKYMSVREFFITPFREERALIGIGVTEKGWVEYAEETQGLTDSQAEHKAHQPLFCDWLRGLLRQHARAEGIPASAYLAAVRFTIRPFAEDPVLFTPTGKQRPGAFLQKFAAEIDDMKNEVVARHRDKRLQGDFVEYDEETDPDDE